VLATATGLVTTSDLSSGDRVSYTAGADDTHLGKALGIRLIKSSGFALYDHLRLRVRNPSGSETIAFTEDFESPKVSGFAEGVLPARHWIGAEDGYGATRHGLFNQRPIFSIPYCGWSGPRPDAGWWLFPLPSTPLHCSVVDRGVYHDSIEPEPIALGQWTHVAVVYSGRDNEDGQAEISIYINGYLAGTRRVVPNEHSTPISSLPTAQRMWIGAIPGTGPGDPTLDADIDELHILRAALNEKEIWRLMDGNVVEFRAE
jgi:hypothetical protein